VPRPDAAPTPALGTGSRLDVVRDGPRLALTMRLDRTVTELVVRQRDTGRERRVPVADGHVEVDLEDLWRWSGDVERFLDLSIVLDDTDEVRLGGFDETDRERAFGQHVMVPRAEGELLDRGLTFTFSRAGNAAVHVGPTRRKDVRTATDRMTTRRGRLHVEARFTTGNNRLDRVRLLAVVRETGAEHELPLEVEHHPDLGLHRAGLPHHSVRFDVAFDDVAPDGHVDGSVLDLVYEMTFVDSDLPLRRGIVMPPLKGRLGLREMYARGAEHATTFIPYRTSKAHRVAFNIETTTPELLRYRRRIARLGPLLTLLRPFLRVWLVGEQPFKAQDNGYHFFRWVRTNRPRRRAYYVADPGLANLAELEALGNLVLRGSKRHLRLNLVASRILSTHHADYLLASRAPGYRRWVRGRRIFLQHGVMGTKNMAHLYGRRAPGFRTDDVVVSSAFEAEILRNDFGYEAAQVHVTGLARFDSLLDGSVEPDRSLLVIPTWRDWLLNPADVPDSEYVQTWAAVLDHPRLRALTDDGVRVRFILHPNMRAHTHLFERPWVEVLQPGVADVQQLMKSSAAMLTDYSSVGFDFAMLERPAFYLQPDRRLYLSGGGSHLDLDAHLPGRISFDVETAVGHVVESASRGFVVDDESLARSRRFLDHRDLRSSERIHDLALRRSSPMVAVRRLRASVWSMRLFETFRRSKAYGPAMRALFRLARLLPRQERVVLESGLGKQYGDSPRAVHEELLRRGTDLALTWVNDTSTRIPGNDVEKVRRLHPRYFWRLGRARYWVNNQNFPHYLQPASGTRYLQTWHGTPLKRMQHDIEGIRERDPEYIEKVTRMTGYWDALVSPSPYATECFRSAFRFTGDVLETGYPRNDLFHAPDAAERGRLVRQRLRIPEGRKVVLYAPTFRDDVKRGNSFLADLRLDLELLQRRLGEDYVVLLRFHSIVKGRPEIRADQQDFVRDVTLFPDTQDLLLVADVLMTDYSSIMFDYAALDRPMVFFTYDLDHYRGSLRGFYLDFEDVAPGPLVRTSEEVVEALSDLDALRSRYADQRAAFVERFAPLDDGHAAARVVDAFFGPA
jgi:CDP-glycerol glycerophosphotransferase